MTCQLLDDRSHHLGCLACTPRIGGNHGVRGFGGNKSFYAIIPLVGGAAIGT
jgi:hypothetical protein